FKQSGISADAGTNTVLALAGPTNYNVSQFDITQWVDDGAGIGYTFSPVVGSATAGKQFTLTSATPATVAAVTSPTTVTGVYKTRWQVTFKQSGISADAGTNTVLALAGPTNYNVSQFDVTQWVDSGSPISYTYAATVGTSTSGKRYALTVAT